MTETVDQQAVAAAFLQMNEMFGQWMEAATGIKAMALQQGFTEKDASHMGAASFEFVLNMALKGQGNGDK